MKGRLLDGSLVTVKVLSVEVESMRGEREFVAELATLANIKHQNLVSLKGCCVEGVHRYLVYDYMENNNLYKTFLGMINFCYVFLSFQFRGCSWRQKL